jgi:hypothetical protein
MSEQAGRQNNLFLVDGSPSDSLAGREDSNLRMAESNCLTT